jgi:hypothetical protein
MRGIRGMRNNVYKTQVDFMDERYKQIYRRTLARTMVATGELRSRLFIRQKSISFNATHFSCGYDSTSNNQSVAQEFELGAVHTSAKEHRHPDGTGKCSRRPVDLFVSRGGQYFANRSARRRALASAVEDSLQTEVRFATMLGHTYRYEPSLSNIVRKLMILTRAVVRVAF